ncbi:MAG: transcription repressor NadR [Bacillota bacterium]|jgi:transcriptional regulator of NAD metabolism
MTPQARREEIVKILQEADSPVTGGELANSLGVSRQVIVQDIALLRAGGLDILATPQGYLLAQAVSLPLYRRTFAVVHHDLAGLEKELYQIVDCGGRVVDVIVEHPIYGEITGLLMLSSRREVAEFVKKLKESRAQPLAALTGGVHLHTVEALSQEVLNRVEERLKEIGVLIEENE